MDEYDYAMNEMDELMKQFEPNPVYLLNEMADEYDV